MDKNKYHNNLEQIANNPYAKKNRNFEFRSKSVDINNLLNRVKINKKINNKKKYILVISSLSIIGCAFLLIF
jgi:hypothetical protein|tara:strand:- start:177 stop:392 length:216 start_codon:yes stop_codon:yes gene_type:complete